MRYAIVTETYPPEVNGVALTVHGLETGLRARGHQVDVVRPRQSGDTDAAPALLVRGASLPRVPRASAATRRSGATTRLLAPARQRTAAVPAQRRVGEGL